jgi:hypothetical protein
VVWGVKVRGLQKHDGLQSGRLATQEESAITRSRLLAAEAKRTTARWRSGSSAELSHRSTCKAYDSAELRDRLQEPGTMPIIPSRVIRDNPQIQQAPLQAAVAHQSVGSG